MARTRAASVVAAVIAAGCGEPDPCGDGVAMPGEVCLVRGLPLANGEHAQALMDFDGDGIADLVGLHESFVRLLRGRGDATFEPVGDVAYDSLGGIPFVLRDIDGDGRDELAVRRGESAEDGAPTELRILERDAAGELRLEHTLVVPLPSPGVLEVVGDFEGDGSRDLVLYGAHVVTLVPGTSDGPGDPVAVEPFGINSNGFLQLHAGDVDGDGADELCHAGLRLGDWRPAHLNDDGVLDLAGFGYPELGCGLPECMFYDAPLLSSP